MPHKSNEGLNQETKQEAKQEQYNKQVMDKKLCISQSQDLSVSNDVDVKASLEDKSKVKINGQEVSSEIWQENENKISTENDVKAIAKAEAEDDDFPPGPPFNGATDTEGEPEAY